MHASEFDYTTSDAIGLSEAIRAGVLSPEEAVGEAFAAIDRANPRLNAVILRMEDEARQQLPQLPQDAPLRGVPTLLKDDCPSYAGAPMSYGCRAAVGNVSGTDHEIVSRYRAAGLVVVGKTNLPEFSCNVATEGSLHGPALNPWNTERSIGGSSGGAAAAVASGMVPTAYANDGAGSIRIPAACAGLFGFRPSRGRVPCGPVSSENWGGLVSHHALTRSVRDSAFLLDLTDAPEQGALYAAPAKEGSYLAAAGSGPRRLRVGLVAQSGLQTQPEPEIAKALDDAADRLRGLGHTIVPIAFAHDAGALKEALTTLIATYTAIEVDDVATAFGRPADDDNFEPVNLGLAAFGRELGATEALRARNTANATARAFGRLFAEVDVIMSPVMPTLPLPLGTLDVRSADWRGFVDRLMDVTAFTHPANAAGIPAMSVPMAQGADGLPIGIQFMGPLGGEELLFALAGEIERNWPWAGRRPPIRA